MAQRAGRRSNPGSPHPRHEGSSRLTSLSLILHNVKIAGEYLQPLKGLSEAMQANTSLARSGRLIMGNHYHTIVSITRIIIALLSGDRADQSRSGGGRSFLTMPL